MLNYIPISLLPGSFPIRGSRIWTEKIARTIFNAKCRFKGMKIPPLQERSQKSHNLTIPENEKREIRQKYGQV